MRNKTEAAKFSATDTSFMRAAINLAARGLGNVWPNPAVGCVIVNNGRVTGRGWTQPSGRPHAETEALQRAGTSAKGATAYVSLEPCSHTGKTPPCADALIDAGVKRVVVAVEDPDERVSGTGLARLRDAGIETEVGCCRDEATAVNEGYLLCRREGRPLFTIKSAASLDSQIATATGDSQWITGPEARSAGHLLRLRHDAILVGSETAIADDPELTCRLPGCGGAGNVRIVLDSRLRLSLDSKLVRGAKDAPLWLVTQDNQSDNDVAPYEKTGVEVIKAPSASDGTGIDLSWLAGELASRGLTRVLVEGGAAVAGSFLKYGLADKLAVYRAPMVLGKEGRGQFNGLNLSNLENAPQFELVHCRAAGKDQEETYTKRK